MTYIIEKFVIKSYGIRQDRRIDRLDLTGNNFTNLFPVGRGRVVIFR